jgi:oleate hydratase
MRNYDRVNELPPKGIKDKRAHIIGGGIAGLSAAAFLVSDAGMRAPSCDDLRQLAPDGRLDGCGRKCQDRLHQPRRTGT